MAWEAGTMIGSHEAVTKASWLAVLAALLRHPSVQWLSDVDALTAAENKLTQYTKAADLGIAHPRTLVANGPDSLDLMGEDLVAKPLGPGHYQDADGRWLTVFTDTFDPDEQGHRQLLNGPPFIVQERILATNHLRVTTVGSDAWVFRLPADDLPTDWRQVEQGHHDWTRTEDVALCRQAVTLAHAHDLGYSSQDWIETESRQVFLDLNPGGQWLFLPNPGANEITQSIASWLEEDLQ